MCEMVMFEDNDDNGEDDNDDYDNDDEDDNDDDDQAEHSDCSSSRGQPSNLDKANFGVK